MAGRYKFSMTIFICREGGNKPVWSLWSAVENDTVEQIPGFFSKLKLARRAAQALANGYEQSGYVVTIKGTRI